MIYPSTALSYLGIRSLIDPNLTLSVSRKKMYENNIEPVGVMMKNVLRVYAYVTAVDLMDKHKSEWVDGNLKLEVETTEAMERNLDQY